MRALVAALVAATVILGGRGVAVAQSRRAPTVELWYRRGSIADTGTEGTTNAGGVAIFPLHRVRALRWIRLGVGAELGLRNGADGHSDTVVEAVAILGLQLPGKSFIPFANALALGGMLVEDRFQRTFEQVTYTLGGEAGVNLRVGPLGAGAAIGYGRTVEGRLYSNAAWLRVIVPIF